MIKEKNRKGKDREKVNKQDNEKEKEGISSLWLNDIYKSLALNYKSWIIIIASIILLKNEDETMIGLFLTYFIITAISHLFHYLCHFKMFYPNNICHIYHHENNNFYSHFIQIVLEFVSLLSLIFIKQIIGLDFISVWIILFFYIFYTTVHNINYSVFHVNDTHETHHKVYVKNLGPDIMDILFGTKEGNIENTDHYIINAVVAFVIIYGIKLFWATTDAKEWIVCACNRFYYFMTVLLIVVSFYLYVLDIQKDDYSEFIKDV